MLNGHKKGNCGRCGVASKLKDGLCGYCHDQAEMSEYLQAKPRESEPRGFFDTLMGWLLLWGPRDPKGGNDAK